MTEQVHDYAEVRVYYQPGHEYGGDFGPGARLAWRRPLAEALAASYQVEAHGFCFSAADVTVRFVVSDRADLMGAFPVHVTATVTIQTERIANGRERYDQFCEHLWAIFGDMKLFVRVDHVISTYPLDPVQ